MNKLAEPSANEVMKALTDPPKVRESKSKSQKVKSGFDDSN